MSLKDTTQHSNCLRMSDVLNRIGDKWSVMVVGMLSRSGTLRFNELKRSINGVSQRMLTLTLRNLERDGLVTRSVYPEIPPRVEYSLTGLGNGSGNVNACASAADASAKQTTAGSKIKQGAATVGAGAKQVIQGVGQGAGSAAKDVGNGIKSGLKSIFGN